MNPEAVMIIYVCNGCGALAPDSRQPTTKCACGTHDWRRFTRSK
jgi:DNA-directed RNA polymerase subunit RPC12/RpoP